MAWTPEKQRAYNAEYYRLHRDEEIDRVARRQRAATEWLRDVRRVPCADCGGTYPPHVMDFDHRDPKAKSFSLASGKCLLKTRAELLAEVAKCDVVCANCHRIRTEQQRPDHKWGWPRTGSWKRPDQRRRWLEQLDLIDRLKSVPCADCGGSYPPCAMEFDHRPGETKVAILSRMAGHFATARILEEAAKCDVVCTNCHRERSYQRRRVDFARQLQLLEEAARYAA